MDVVVWGAVGAVAGGLAGAGARVLVGRLRRGTVVVPPWCELAVGAAWAAIGAAAGAGRLPPGCVAVLLALAWFAAAAGAVDVTRRRLPDALTLPALPVALGLVAPLGPAALLRAVAVAVLAVAVHGVVHVVVPQALGAGDVKLAAPLGAVLGAVAWPAAVLAAVLASVLTALLALAARRRSGLPHGPSMLLATMLVSTAGAVVAG